MPIQPGRLYHDKERQTDRQTERHRQTDRQTDRQNHRVFFTHSQPGQLYQAEERERQRDRETQTDRQTDRQTERHRQTDRQRDTDRQTDRQTDKTPFFLRSDNQVGYIRPKRERGWRGGVGWRQIVLGVCAVINKSSALAFRAAEELSREQAKHHVVHTCKMCTARTSS